MSSIINWKTKSLRYFPVCIRIAVQITVRLALSLREVGILVYVRSQITIPQECRNNIYGGVESFDPRRSVLLDWLEKLTGTDLQRYTYVCMRVCTTSICLPMSYDDDRNNQTECQNYSFAELPTVYY